MTIQKYAVFEGIDFTRLDKDDDGGIVLYSDHLKETEELNNIISIAALNLAEKEKEIKEREGNLLTILEEVLDRNKRIDELREALEFYANDNNYHRTLHVGGDYDYSPRLIISIDNGEKARQALKEVKGD